MENQISYFFNKCRCCLSDTVEKNYRDIDESTSSKLKDVLNLELVKSEKLSNRICNACYAKISEIQQLKCELEQNQAHLNNLLLQSCEEEVENCEQYDLVEIIGAHEGDEEEDEEVIMDLDINEFKILPSDDNKCLNCKKTFSNEKKLKAHIARVHKPQFSKDSDLRICAYCGKILKGNNHLNFHIRAKHLNLTKYTCDRCGYSSYGKFEMRSHILIQHLPLELRKKYPCNQCSSVLTTKVSLKTHKTHKHSGLKPHFCFCGKSFALRDTLKSHIKNVHNLERKYKCPDESCNKGFNSNSRLNDHINNVHGQKQEIPCEKCGKVFNSIRNLQTHAVYHSEPTLKCQYCAKLFYIKKNLREHQASNHLGITYDCKICMRTFQSTSGLRRHMRSHEEKP